MKCLTLTMAAIFMAVQVALISILVCLSSCNYTISLTHTQGTAENVGDESETANPNISPNLSIPSKVI